MTAAEMTEEDKQLLTEHLSDPRWRISNLYMIVDKKGNEVPFRPNEPQREMLDEIYVLKRKRHSVLKARRMGFSTLFDLIAFDAAYWGENIQCSIIDRTQTDASEKLTKKCRFAFEHLPRDLQEGLKVDSTRELAFHNGSSINAGKNARGGTNHVLHISEWGPIAHEDPKRSEEIKTGALPSADQGIILNESTFKGGKGGAFYENLKLAQQTPVHLKTEKDFYFHFFGWYRDPTCTLEGDATRVTKETHAYLDKKEIELGIKFTPGQRLFYQVTKEEQGIFMFREYPTTADEAFQAPVEGAIYGDVISWLRAQGRILSFEWDRGARVFAIADLGWNDSMSIWLVQIIGRDIHWIWHTRQRHHTVAQIVALVDASEIPVAGWFLPHDAESADGKEGKTYRDAFEKAGCMNIKVVPRCTSVWPGINLLRDLLRRSTFRLPFTEDGINSLEAYHTKDTEAGGTISREPVHDWSSHSSSAARVLAEAMELGMINTRQAQRIVVAPRMPDGSLADLSVVQQVRRRRDRDVIPSGHTPFA